MVLSGLQWDSLPPWLQAEVQKVVGMSSGFMGEQYPGFRGPLAAPLSPSQTAAIELANQTGNYLPNYAQAEEQFNRGAETFPEHYQDYMNPYTAGVLDELDKQGKKTLEEMILPNIMAHFVQNGTHRSTAHDQQAQLAMRNMMDATMREKARLLHSGYFDTAKQFQDEKLRQQEAGRRYAELGRYRQAGHMGDMEQLMNAGNVERGYNTDVLNEQKAEHARQVHWPHAQLREHAAMLQGLPHSSMSSGVKWSPEWQSQPNGWGTAANLAAGFYGASRMNQGMNEGGSVKAPRMSKAFGISNLKFKTSNKPKKHTEMKFRRSHEGRM